MIFFVETPSGKNFKVRVEYNQLSLFDGENILSRIQLSELEFLILKIISNEGERSNPISSRTIESEIHSAINRELPLNGLKNAIASIRRKFRDLVSAINIVPTDCDIIANVNRVGYYIALSKLESVNRIAEINNEINSYLPKKGEAIISLLFHQRDIILFKVLRYFLFSIFVITALYFVQIYYVISIKKIEFNNANKVLNSVAEYYLGGFVGEEIYSSISDDYISDSIFIIENGNPVCLIDKNKILKLSENKKLNDIFTSWYSNRDKYFYNDITLSNIRVISRAKKKSIVNQYKNFIFHPFLKGIKYTNDFHGEVGRDNRGIKIFTNKELGGEMTFYGDNLHTQVLIVFFIFLVFGERVRVVVLWKYVERLSGFSMKVEPVVNVNTSSCYYFELLSRFEKCTPIKAIGSMKKHGLLNFHTTLMIESISKVTSVTHVFSVNLCPSLLTNRNFSKLLNAFRKCNPDIIMVELTEYSDTPYCDRALSNLNKIKALGISIVIDDFGVGNNNLFLIKKLGAKCIKIDKSFIDNLESDIKQQKFVKDIIVLVGGDTDYIIFEGIERENQSLLLKRLGGIYQQGYLFKEGHEVCE